MLGGVRRICAVDALTVSEATFITTAVELAARACSDGELGEAAVAPVSTAEAMMGLVARKLRLPFEKGISARSKHSCAGMRESIRVSGLLLTAKLCVLQ